MGGKWEANGRQMGAINRKMGAKWPPNGKWEFSGRVDLPEFGDNFSGSFLDASDLYASFCKFVLQTTLGKFFGGCCLAANLLPPWCSKFRLNFEKNRF